MTCPICGGATVVRCSRGDCESVCRRRKCLECDHIFYTTELESTIDDFTRLDKIAKVESRERRKSARSAADTIKSLERKNIL